MKIVKGILITLFIFLIVLNIGLTIFLNATFHTITIIILLLLIFILVYKKKISWLIGICLFAYGILSFVFFRIAQSSQSVMEFTATLNTLLFGGYTGNPIRKWIQLFPYIFYCVALILFLTKPVRKYYHV